MKEFTKNDCRKIGVEALRALEAVATEYGLAVSRGNGRFTSTTYAVKFEFAVVGDDGVAQTKEVSAFESNTKRDGVNAKLGDSFYLGGKKFVLTGYNTRARKMPYQTKCIADGKNYKFSPIQVINAFAASPGPTGGFEG